MTKIRNVKLATKFVFKSEPGVWKKMTTNKAKCIFGAQDTVGTEVGIDPDSEVFVIESSPRNESPRDETKLSNEMVKVVFEDTDEDLICEQIVTMSEAQLMAASVILPIRTAPRKHRELFDIGDVGFDIEKRILHLEVMNREKIPSVKIEKTEGSRD
jgi:hypothetical protein